LDHRDIDKRLAHLGHLLIVFAQAAKTVEPAQRAFHHPALGQHREARLVTALDDFGGNPKLLATPVQQAVAVVAAVKQELLPARDKGDSPQQPAGTDFVLHIGSMDDDAHQPTVGLDGQVAFDAFGLLVTIKAAGPLFSAVWTDWLSMISKLGSGSRPAWTRT